MLNQTEQKSCPVCGQNIFGNEHSRIGERETPEGTVEYWACFLTSDVFSVKGGSLDGDEHRLRNHRQGPRKKIPSLISSGKQKRRTR